MVSRDALAAGLAASSDLFPAAVLKALLFLGCRVAQLVKLGLGGISVPRKAGGFLPWAPMGSEMLIEASSCRTRAERGAHLCAENRVFPLQTIRASSP